MLRDDPHIPLIRQAIDHLRKLPGIGPKAASQIAYHLLTRPVAEIEQLSETLVKLRNNIRFCPECGGLTEEVPCRVCADPTRDHQIICVVEQPIDIVALERSAVFRGKYHVLGGALSPLEGVGPEDLRIEQLVARLESDVNEVILATNPNMDGDATALYLEKLIAPKGICVTRMARGLPVGTSLGFADDETLAQAFHGRK